ncbi:RNA polymerase sigma24 factor [Streptomyces albiflavescens]|uniref:RNA polymerase sigma24 factor n=1 Tax=Streptomyces albiflavescens TaxID=1623582 RepID=A0A917YE94_9ACTN|nr:sigma-70 family RNA polymerase sigma factor [Streptomyces albiflavescens]GGN93783.1 RNA polymerase sigma24 factor [Streptomyces albiflavescens]
MNDHESPDGPATAPANVFDSVRLAIDAEFSDFYRANIQQLVGFLINQGASLPTAADIAQDTMAKAYQNWGTIHTPRAWAHTVASRTLVRKIASIREEPVDRLPEPTSLLPSPDSLKEWESHHQVLALLQHLPPRQRQVLAWRFNGYTPQEIAEQLGMTATAVRSNLKKARRAVARRLTCEEAEQ